MKMRRISSQSKDGIPQACAFGGASGGLEVESTIKEGAANIAGAEMKECMTSATTRDEKSDCRKSFVNAIKAVTSDVVEDDEAKLLQKESARKTAAMKLASCLKEARKILAREANAKGLPSMSSRLVSLILMRLWTRTRRRPKWLRPASALSAQPSLSVSSCRQVADKPTEVHVEAKQDLSDKADISDDTESDDAESDDDENDDEDAVDERPCQTSSIFYPDK